jgi:hypothetical protein
MDGAKQVLLVPEVVREHAAGHARSRHELLGAHGGVTAPGEERVSGLQQCAAGGLGSLIPCRR